jgi:ankyrin repeat protein
MIEKRDKATIRLLLKDGADIMAKDNSGTAALHSAALSGDLAIA